VQRCNHGLQSPWVWRSIRAQKNKILLVRTISSLVFKVLTSITTSDTSLSDRFSTVQKNRRPLTRRLVGLQSCSERSRQEQKLLILPKIETRPLFRPTRSLPPTPNSGPIHQTIRNKEHMVLSFKVARFTALLFTYQILKFKMTDLNKAGVTF
jgi:hypothetical protein